MSDIFSAMNDAANTKEIVTENQNQNRNSGALEYMQMVNDVGITTNYQSAIPMTMPPNPDNFSQYNNGQMQNYPPRLDYNQNSRIESLNVPSHENEQNVTRGVVSGGSFQIPFNPGHNLMQHNGGIGLNSQGPLLSSGNYSNLKHIHHNLTNTEPFVSVQPTHSQFSSTAVGAAGSGHTGHSVTLSSEVVLPRGSFVPSHGSHGSLHPPAPDSISTSISNSYLPVNRNVGVVSQHHPVHQLPMHPSSGHNYQLTGQQVPLHYPTSTTSNNSGSSYLASSTNFSGNNGRGAALRSWHSTDHTLLRESVADEIVKILKSRKPNAGDGWHDKLPHMAKRLEDALYQDASSYEEYADRNTLKQRLQQLALSMGSKNQSKSVIGQNQSSTNSTSTTHGQVLRQSASNYVQSNAFPQNISGQSHLQHNTTPSIPTQYVNYHPAQQLSRPSQVAPQYSQLNSTLHHQSGSVPMGLVSAPPYHGNSELSQIGPNGLRSIAGTSNGPSQSYLNGDQQMDGFSRSYQSSMPGTSSQGVGIYKTMDDQNHFGNHIINRPVQVIQSNSITSQNIGVNNSIPPPNPPIQNTDEHRKQVLKQQQQRLLLLRHASKCPHENGRCPVTPHCWNMKQLWKHIMSCKDQDCKVAHCVSSRYVLSHYSKCKEPSCPVCGPVREAIKRNYERSRDVVKMSRNPNAGNVSSLGQSHINGSNNGVISSLSKIDEPEKKKVRRKGDVTASTVVSTTQVVQPLVIRQPPRKIYPLDPISSAIYSFTNEQIQAHFRTIHEGLRLTVNKIKEMCKPILEDLFRIPHVQGVFGTPVDAAALGLADYFDVVKVPMDLGTVAKRLEGGSYRDLQNFVCDVHLTFDNAMLYNPKNTDVYLLASNVKKEFDKKYRFKISEFEKQIEENRKNKDACLVCGEVALKYEPPVYYCNGTCAQRIRRNAVFYSNNSNTYHWCSLCFNAMKESDTIRLPDCIITKAELASNKKKHIEESGEGWVECEGGCRRWIHQICSLFNNRRNISDDVSYVCPLCLQEKRRKSSNEEIVAPTTKKMKASDLPVTTLSDFLEKRILKRLELAYEETAYKSNTDVSAVERCPTLTLRQVSCIDKLQPVRDGFYQRYKDRGYPTDFPCRSKCLVLFQNIDGQDVILFGMYVYEYGHRCPQPNQRRLYISYLDSVHYLRPKQYRTLVYHEILISYLDYMKARGFHTVHIWACPPQKGDDYILYVHPQDQKTPKPQILRLWYDEMLKRCMERGIVCEMTDLHSEFLADPNVEATSLPYFEGDYWVNEAEVIIKNLTDGKKDDDLQEEISGSKSKRRSKAKRPGKIEASGSGVGKSERDPLMAKLAAIIEPMKDTFFVARLHPKEYVEKLLTVSTNVDEADVNTKEKSDQELQEEALSGQDIVPQLPEMQLNANSKGKKRPREDDELSRAEASGGEDDEDNNSEDDFLKNATYITENSSGKDSGESNEKDHISGSISLEPNENRVSPEAIAPPTNTEVVEQSCSEAKEITEEPLKPYVKKIIPCGDELPSLPDNTEDVDDIQESEHFDTRQSFLNLCQGNHYQFDQLRRAKHSSMMVLYHLHNPDAPKFVPSCGHCHLDILTGSRYRCEKCELDYCQSCVSRIGPSIHNHPLRPLSGGNSAPTKLTEEQRRERQRSIQLHMQLLNHAANCIKCESRNCAKMKDFLLHESQCKIKSAGGCRLCSRISNLLNIHARSCRIENCKVPQCLKLREQFRQLALSQQRMDDRRRKKMNSEYNRGTTEVRVDDDDT